MKTLEGRDELYRIFNTDWEEFKRVCKDAKAPFPIKVDWRCMALGRRTKGQVCAFGERVGRMDEVDRAFVTENFTYIRFKGSETVWRYYNPSDMRAQIRYFDEHGMFDDMEEGDEFVLEPPRKAHSWEYSRKRRKDIKEGVHFVAHRGPNPNMKRTPQHHFRPY